MVKEWLKIDRLAVFCHVNVQIDFPGLFDVSNEVLLSPTLFSSFFGKVRVMHPPSVESTLQTAGWEKREVEVMCIFL